MIRLALFDCDGTLVDSLSSICAAMEECFAASALPLPNVCGRNLKDGLTVNRRPGSLS